MSKYNVGIIGNGFVGEAQAFAFSPVSNIKIYDVDESKSTHSITDVHNCDFVFVCVPTPMKKDGSQDNSYIKAVFKNATTKPIYVIKSTVLPGTTNKLINNYKSIKIVFSPEFLSERTAKIDMMTQARIIIGGDEKHTLALKDFFNTRFMNKNVILTDTITAEIIKYMNNTFFATKVSIANEFKLLCDKIGADWETAINGFASDSRVADSHLHVPGPDGKIGYGGTCFPKDVCSIIKFAEQKGINLNTIKAGWETNLQLRPERDWEEKSGRSVSW